MKKSRNWNNPKARLTNFFSPLAFSQVFSTPATAYLSKSVLKCVAYSQLYEFWFGSLDFFNVVHEIIFKSTFIHYMIKIVVFHPSTKVCSRIFWKGKHFILIIFYTVMRKVVLWYFFTGETSQKIHNSTFQVKISV